VVWMPMKNGGILMKSWCWVTIDATPGLDRWNRA
jgi:hypothetical protein